MACSPSPDKEAADKLNSLSYDFHYRSLDSTEYYAQRAMEASARYCDGRAEALNNLAFVRIARMEYEEAQKLLEQIPATTDNQLELLIGYIQQMRLCQRTSQNRAFYDCREQALKALRRVSEERETLDDRQWKRLVYAESELAIVTSAYYYYVGLEQQSAQALYDMPADLKSDTAQYLNYLYNVGSGGMITSGTQEQINQEEFDHLMRCYMLSVQAGIPYFAANSLESLAEHLMNADYRERLIADNLPAFKFFNPEGLDNELLPLDMAKRSLELFSEYGDIYQIAGAHRTLASCYLASDDYEPALYHLEQALQDSVINKAPDLVASIREQLSVAYAAIDDKANSDHNRNIYLDLQEQTRQDRSLEARAGQLEQAAGQLNVLIYAVVGAIVLLVLLLVLFSWLHHRRKGKKRNDSLAQQEEELQEKLAMARLHVEKEQRLALEQRAKMSLVNGITPLIDRIIHEVSRIDYDDHDNNGERMEYISELTDNINEQNEVLTHWIQLRQGQLSLHIESFALQQLFDIVGMGRRSFEMKGLELKIEPTALHVKADRVLTLFMLNTLADNARKFTSEGGIVSIGAAEGDAYVEISVSDTGVGMDEEQLVHVFDRKVILDDKSQASHGFGLINCKGIIEKYRKISRIFSVCQLKAESEKGKGSRFFFRLPKGLVKMLLPLVAMSTTAMQTRAEGVESAMLSMASAYADSAYYSNINQTYDLTLDYADSCRQYLNMFYRELKGNGSDTLLALGDLSLVPPEVIWYHDSIRLNYNILLTMRNESAVAALALHEWGIYQYNNRIYTQLFKEMSADATLDEYCRKMQQSQTNKQVAIVLLAVLFMSIIIAVIAQVVAALGKAVRRRQEEQDRLEMERDEVERVEMEEAALHVSNAVVDNCLSTLKHETMYYPSRISQLMDSGDTRSLAEVAAYYRELYGILSLQAQHQTEHMKLHLKPLDLEAVAANKAQSKGTAVMALADPVLVGYMFELLRKESDGRTLKTDCKAKDDRYVVCTVKMPFLHLDARQAALLFTPSTRNIPYLLCRQIVRDHGEVTNRRGCAIRAEVNDGSTDIIIILPRSMSK